MSNQLTMATIHTIETLHKAGYSNRQISAMLHVHRETVGKFVARLRQLTESAPGEQLREPPQNRPQAPTGLPTGFEGSVGSVGVAGGSVGRPLTPQIDGHLLTFVCGFFPACGAALAGISNQGEFRRIAQRSRSMADQLKVKLQQVEAVERQLADSSSTATQLSPELSNAASTTSQLMVNEVLDWRVIFQDRPLRTT